MSGGSEYVFLGYESAGDVGKESLGDPIAIKSVNVAAILASDTPDDSVIDGENEYVYPVIVKAKPIYGINVLLENKQWTYTETTYRAEIGKALETIAANSIDPASAYLLDIEDIGMEFVGYVIQGKNFVIPLYGDSSQGIVPGQKYEWSAIAPKIKAELLANKEAIESMFPATTKLPGVQKRSETTGTSEPINKLLYDVPLIGQQQKTWGWAATTQMTMLYAGGDPSIITQCALVNYGIWQDSCCVDGSTKICNRFGRPDYEHWGFTAKNVYEREGAALSWEELKSEIDGGRPINFMWMTYTGGLIYMVAVGYFENTSTNPITKMVYVNAPWPLNEGQQTVMTYDTYIGKPGYFNFIQTYYFYDIKKK
jgi:hypothetical protein